MEPVPILRQRLQSITEEAIKKQKEDLIRNVVREISTNVLSYAKKGLFSYTYPRCGYIQHIAVEIIAMLKMTFPDSDVHYNIIDNEDNISINWA
jgi:hypothetical protein